MTKLGPDRYYFYITGPLEPAGSPKIIRRGRTPAIVWQKGPRWTAHVRAFFDKEIPENKRPLLTGPVVVELKFLVPKPQKPKFPVPATPPDGDKLERATWDGFTTKDRKPLLLEDDSRIVDWSVKTRYADALDAVGVLIWVRLFKPSDI